jgi:hypothetical protein
MLNTRRYLITITDAESREVVIFTGADWTAEERQIAVPAQKSIRPWNRFTEEGDGG